MQSGREAGEAYIELVTIVSLIVGAFTCCTLLVSKQYIRINSDCNKDLPMNNTLLLLFVSSDAQPKLLHYAELTQTSFVQVKVQCTSSQPTKFQSN